MSDKSDGERIAVLENQAVGFKEGIDALKKSIDELPEKISSKIQDKITISTLECAKSRDKSYAFGLKASHISSATISGILIGLWKFVEWARK